MRVWAACAGWVAVGLVLAAALPSPCVAAPQERTSGPDVPLGLELYVPVPEDNPTTPNKVELGRRLFFEPLLSRDSTITCASCHRPDHGFADPVDRSVGVGGRQPARHTPSLLNAGYRDSFFWDGRETSLEAQVVQPIRNPDEMGLPVADAVQRLGQDSAYVSAFESAFPDGLTAANLSRALATFVRSLRSGNSPLDRYVAGDTGALAPLAREGYRLFLGKARCTNCHAGPLLSDGRFHNTGVGWGEADEGRAAVTGRSEDRGRFKTPSLRDVSLTAPYMHDGSLATLEEVVRFYDGGGGANPLLDRDLRPLELSPLEQTALVVFLRSLEGVRP